MPESEAAHLRKRIVQEMQTTGSIGIGELEPPFRDPIALDEPYALLSLMESGDVGPLPDFDAIRIAAG